ncbi:MAG: DUF1015 domain-containing protein, partial [Actinomycetia bacterium]|nr:DUF1015 domain-containing protein [Actinomycetes bacterium]
MPRFAAFRALRYAPDTDLTAVTAPPYDVLSDADVARYAARSEHSIARVDNPQAMWPDAGDEAYAMAAAALGQWVEDGVLVLDDEESLTIYRLTFVDDRGRDRELTLVFGAVEVVDEGAGGVLAHERTTPKASTDRLDLTRASGANLSPIWGLSLGSGLTELLADSGEPVGSAKEDGIEHCLERVTDPARIAAICACVESAEVLIADGHHRYAVARTFRDEVRAATGRADTGAELTLIAVAELNPEQLSIEAIHRLYSGTSHDDVRDRLADWFEISAAPMPSRAMLADLEHEGRLALIGPSGDAEWLTPKEGVFDDVRSLDGAWLEAALAGSDVEVSYQHGVDEVLEAVVTGRAHSAVLIRPTSIEEIERTGHERLLMPPKSTFFTPKLRTGLVLRPLDLPPLDDVS